MNRNRRTILALTGIRSEYFILRQVLKGIVEHPDLQLSLVATGAHLSPVHGFTIKVIEDDELPIEETIVSLFSCDALIGRIKGAGVQIISLAQTVERVKPDFILVMGDREESLVGAIVGTYMNIPVAHMGGGDRVVGNVDDAVRHAVTKLAHLHFAFSKESSQRIIKLGEEPWRVFLTGSPALDDIRLTPSIPLDEISRQLGFPIAKPFILLLQHPLSSEHEEAGKQMETTLQAVSELGYRTIVIYPNTDAGSYSIIEVINRYANQYNFIKACRTPLREVFVNCLRQAAILVGNSSCGIHEAPFLNLPVVNVGGRQTQRLHAENVVFVPFDKDRIKETISKVINDEELRAKLMSCSSPYGDSHAAERIVRILTEVPLDKKLLNKGITY